MSLQSHLEFEGARDARPVTAAAMGIVAGYVGLLAILFFQHKWVLTPEGRPIASDFLAYWAAGLTSLSGHAAATYQIAPQHAFQVTLTGPFPDYYYWNYPPSFFFVVALLGLLPFTAAFFVWVVTTGAAFAVAIGRIAGGREEALYACACPAVLINAYVGQSGFLAAALLGAALLLLPRRPILSGLLFGLMTYKPQFGILIPLVLLAGGYWRAVWAASATVLMTAASAGLAFGTGSYAAFFHALPVITQTSLTAGGAGWSKMESLYSIARFVGLGDGGGWIVQSTMIAACAGTVIWLWRRNTPYPLKAAALVVAAMLSTPYLHEYDFPVLLVAFAFLWRQRHFDRLEWIAVAVAYLMMAAFLAQWAPLGPIVVMIAGGMTLRRLIIDAEEIGRDATRQCTRPAEASARAQ